jgi:hypothetical protein
MPLVNKLFPTSAGVQKEYADKRIRHLIDGDPAKTAAVKSLIEAMMAKRGRQGDWWCRRNGIPWEIVA